mmetsp:Transcript_10305/g.22900  ORF Transcript_10305/g.22900 Transcript_10305/m.22900 type:complete len:101 (-) Transcript_10305:232-534(-)
MHSSMSRTIVRGAGPLENRRTGCGRKRRRKPSMEDSVSAEMEGREMLRAHDDPPEMLQAAARKLVRTRTAQLMISCYSYFVNWLLALMYRADISGFKDDN